MDTNENNVEIIMKKLFPNKCECPRCELISAKLIEHKKLQETIDYFQGKNLDQELIMFSPSFKYKCVNKDCGLIFRKTRYGDGPIQK